MASNRVKFKNSTKKEKAYLLVIISFFAILLSLCIKSTFAYYSDSVSLSILANSIGDFDIGDGDINMMIYKQNENNEYVRSYAVPVMGYDFNQSLTKCTIPCSTNSSDNCYYHYDEEKKSFSITSTDKVTCKFYFDKVLDSDLNVYIMKEDATGAFNYNSKNYSLVESVPAYGYEYVNYKCDNMTNTTVNYISETRKFVISTPSKNNCYAYFNNVSNADIVVNVFVQNKVGSDIYDRVNSIPVDKLYIKSTSIPSACYDTDKNNTGATITYENGYIDISATSNQTCDVYLDLAS